MNRPATPYCVDVPPALNHGKRKRVFFQKKGEAKAYAAQLLARKENLGTSASALTPAQALEAAEAFRLLGEHPGHSLLEAVREFLDGVARQRESVPYRALFDLYIEAKKDRSPEYLRELRITRNRFESLHDRLVCDITPRDLEAVLNDLTPGARAPVMRYFRAVFRFGVKRGYLAQDPIAKLDFPRRDRQEVEIVPVPQVAKMLDHAFEQDLELLPFLTLGFFAGLRPDGELQKIEWRDMDLNGGELVVRPEVSKTRRRRFVAIPENAKAWLHAYTGRGGKTEGRVTSFTESQLRTHRKANWKSAGIERWPQQGMRHTFCTFWLAMHKDVNRLVLMSGHDDADTMWRHYHRGATEAEAAAFWALRPPAREGAQIIRLSA